MAGVSGDPSPGKSSASLLERLRGFFTDRVWLGLDASGGPRPLAAVRGTARLCDAVVRGFFRNRLTLRAAALSYYAVLSLVPFLAFAFAILKGLGAYRGFVNGSLRPWLDQTFGGNPSLLAAMENVLGFVDRTNVSTLGVVGLLTLVYTSVSLLSSVESALNDIWGARTQRPFLRQITDYVTLLVTTPLLLVAATTVATAAQSSQFVHFLRGALHLGVIIDFLLRFTSLVVVAIAMFGLYVILPNVRVRPVSALLGAVVSALLWQGALVLHVRFQMGVARYNALYSVLGALPIFLVWTYFSWLVVLIGAQVGACHQNLRTAGSRFAPQAVDQALRERLALALAALVARDFRSGTRRGEAGLADELRISRATAADLLATLIRGRILVRAAADRDAFYLPAREPTAIGAGDIRDAIRRDPGADPLRFEVDRHLPARLRELLDEAENPGRSGRQLTLQELSDFAAGCEPEGVPTSRVEHARPEAGTPASADQR